LATNFYAHDEGAAIKKTQDRLELATVERRKEPFESWRTRVENQMPSTVAVAANYTLPTISPNVNGCADDTWTATSTTNAPSARDSHTAVWTGSEMIVWGGYTVFGSFDVNTGGSYNPSTDSWITTSTTNAPTARAFHTAVWTGSEMIVWGGVNNFAGDFNTGGRYNPGTDTWATTSTANAPTARYSHTAVWTGSEMIIWGGYHVTSSFNTGGRYNPGTDSWTATSATNAPSGRYNHTAVWTGSEMIIWGWI
jgi:N-acetylneuraminic acid mutarotase